MERKTIMMLIMYNPVYVHGGCITATLFRKFKDQDIELSVMVCPFIYENYGNLLSRYYDNVIKVDLIDIPCDFGIKKYHWINLCLTKWKFVGMTEFSKILFVGIDVFPVDSKFNKLFETETDFGFMMIKIGHRPQDITQVPENYDDYCRSKKEDLHALHGDCLFVKPNAEMYNLYKNFTDSLFINGSDHYVGFNGKNELQDKNIGKSDWNSIQKIKIFKGKNNMNSPSHSTPDDASMTYFIYHIANKIYGYTYTIFDYNLLVQPWYDSDISQEQMNNEIANVIFYNTISYVKSWGKHYSLCYEGELIWLALIYIIDDPELIRLYHIEANKTLQNCEMLLNSKDKKEIARAYRVYNIKKFNSRKTLKMKKEMQNFFKIKKIAPQYEFLKTFGIEGFTSEDFKF